MKKLVFILSAMLLLIGTMDVQAQWGKKLLKKAGESAKRATERNVERKVEQTVDKAFEGAEDVVTGKGNNNNEKEEPPTSTNSQGNFETMDDGEDLAQQEQQQPQQSLEMTYAKSDFVPGDEIIFEDDVTREQIGEFLSQWDLLKGTVEIAQINGDKVILCVSQDDPVIAPLFDNMKSYLPEKFTLEFDFWVGPFTKKGDDEPENCYIVRFYKPESGSRVQTINLDDWYYSASDHRTRLRWDFIPSSGENSRSGSDDSFRTIPNSWNHFSLSFNQRAMKVYINGIRYANIPNTVKLSQELVNMELDEDSERSEAWDLLATQSIASPYPYFFEAISWDYKGKEDKARECYANAMCNPAFPSTVWDFSYWQDLTSGELRAIARRLLPKEEEYRKYFHLSTYSCPHHYLNFDDDYLTAKAADTLVVLPTAVGAALMLYETAVQANPFNARNFAGASLLSVQNGDSVKAAYYLNEGLLIDPENKGLQALLNVWKGGHK